MREFKWDSSKSKQNILQSVAKQENIQDESELVNLPKVKEYKENLTKMFNQGETETNILEYKKSVLNLLKVKSS